MNVEYYRAELLHPWGRYLVVMASSVDFRGVREIEYWTIPDFESDWYRSGRKGFYQDGYNVEDKLLTESDWTLLLVDWIRGEIQGHVDARWEERGAGPTLPPPVRLEPADASALDFLRRRGHGTAAFSAMAEKSSLVGLKYLASKALDIEPFGMDPV